MNHDKEESDATIRKMGLPIFISGKVFLHKNNSVDLKKKICVKKTCRETRLNEIGVLIIAVTKEIYKSHRLRVKIRIYMRNVCLMSTGDTRGRPKLQRNSYFDG